MYCTHYRYYSYGYVYYMYMYLVVRDQPPKHGSLLWACTGTIVMYMYTICTVLSGTSPLSHGSLLWSCICTIVIYIMYYMYLVVRDQPAVTRVLAVVHHYGRLQNLIYHHLILVSCHPVKYSNCISIFKFSSRQLYK